MSSLCPVTSVRVTAAAVPAPAGDAAAAVQVRVQAGAKVQDVVEALRPHGLTLQNYASVRDQQIGGFTQVSAHGTGAALPPVDEQVVAMRLVAPGLGQAVELRRGVDAAFPWAKVGLGGMGVVTEVTLQCVASHRLLEETTVTTRAAVERSHAKCGALVCGRGGAPSRHV